MSRELVLTCTQCKEYIWIAQEGLSGRTLYYGMSEVMKALRDFLFTHEQHPLIFQDSDRVTPDDMDDDAPPGYTEIVPEVQR